jgi:hypothetical protein
VAPSPTTARGTAAAPAAAAGRTWAGEVQRTAQPRSAGEVREVMVCGGKAMEAETSWRGPQQGMKGHDAAPMRQRRMGSDSLASACRLRRRSLSRILLAASAADIGPLTSARAGQSVFLAPGLPSSRGLCRRNLLYLVTFCQIRVIQILQYFTDLLLHSMEAPNADAVNLPLL